MMQQVRVKRVLLFLVLTFTLTWGVHLLIALTVTQSAYLERGFQPVGMLFPAFSALILQTLVFKDSPLYVHAYKDKARWVFYTFLLLTPLSGAITLVTVTTQVHAIVLQGAGGILITLWTFVVFYIYRKSGRESFKRAGLQIGNKGLGLRFIAGVVLFLLSQAALNMRPYDSVFSFGLGIYGLMCLAVVVLVIMRDPIWQHTANHIEEVP